MSWVAAALAVYTEPDPESKARLTLALARLDVDAAQLPELPVQPGRPLTPELVPPAQVARRKLGSAAGRIALVHAVAHIEFNAINLALDAALRFAGMPDRYYADWISVAVDEARHFQLLRDRLQTLGSDYGDLPAHNGLWEMAEKTADDPMVRMALVPRVLEARGLDVTPGMIERLRAVGDSATVEALEVILREEVRHVEIGTRWFRFLCQQRGLDADTTFLQLLAEQGVQVAAKQLNASARSAAGFSADELLALSAF